MNTPDPNANIRKMVSETEAVVEAGWNILRELRRRNGCYLSDKECFFAGAAFLFDAVLHSISPDRDPTAEDLAIISKLHDELQAFNDNFNLKIASRS